ncbi:hypothetical protein DRW48_10590 [Paracoccus suum]|uniref:Uncharacterized protein n=1 Tax=Paracoccus suum TaxID=2259340 RepID=A0A344PL27_9RHOB|nr:hypothetical protein [Paracoccus suum]AXC50082.1 hypothetical protein DRW48_10590 [Paracoccus suum]
MLSRIRWFTKFPERKLEFGLAFYTLGLGLWLARPGLSFSGSAGFSGVTSIMREDYWAALFICVGSLHAYALHINGRAAWTPFARLVALFVNGLVLFNLAFGFWLYTPLSSGVYTYGFMAFGFCGMAIYAAAKDCGREIAIWRSRVNG